jgi:O-methyltransferase
MPASELTAEDSIAAGGSMAQAIKRLVLKCYWAAVTLVTASVVLLELLRKSTGTEYGLSVFQKLGLMLRMWRNTKSIPTASHWLEHAAMALRILKVPKSAQGVIVECGCYKGGSAANLSLVAALCGRRLVIFDSFEGIPAPSACDATHVVIDQEEIHRYEKGAYGGEVNEVKANIERRGRLDACDFRAGFFEKTLPVFEEKVVFVFADVDLRDSLECCVRNLWPRLVDGCCFFTHEAHHFEIASLFFDTEWWRTKLGASPPGLIGAGCGLGLLPRIGAFGSALGYAVRNATVDDYDDVPQRG